LTDALLNRVVVFDRGGDRRRNADRGSARLPPTVTFPASPETAAPPLPPRPTFLHRASPIRILSGGDEGEEEEAIDGARAVAAYATIVADSKGEEF